MAAWLRRSLRRVVNLLRWRQVDRELREEVAAHLELAAAAHRQRGLDAAAARRAAVREFGGERWVEASRSARGVPLLQEFAGDARHALRLAGRGPGFSLAVMLVIALGVGATTAVYSVLRGVLLNPLPYADPASLHTLLEGQDGPALRLLSYPTFRDVAATDGGVVSLSYVRGQSLVVRGAAGTLNVFGAFVSDNYFELLGRDAVAGRTFGASERGAPVAVLSSRLASAVFGDARSALGRTLTTPEGAFEVIGVMPAGFAYPVWAELWLPIEALPGSSAFALEQRDLHVDSDVLVRLHPGVKVEQAVAALSASIARASAQHPAATGEFDRAVLTPLRDRVLGPGMPRLGLLLGCTVLVLVLASVNVAGLVLARGLARRGELAARLALGAGRGRLVRQLMTESAVLGVAGGAAGVLLAGLLIARLQATAPELLPRMEEIAVDGGVLLFALAATLASAVAFGGFAAFGATAGVAADAIRSAGRAATADRGALRLRGGLVVVQIALAVVLLVGASLLVRTGREMARIDLGFQPAGLTALWVFPPDQYGDDAARLLLYERLRDELARVPGVERVVLANHIPLTLAGMPTVVQTERVPPPGSNPLAFFRSVSWDYLATIGATARAGRLFTESDVNGTGVVVNETLARREWGDDDPVGRPITIFRSAQGAAGFGEPLPGYVLGVVRDIREQGPDRNVAPAVYVPLERNVWTNIHVVVKSAQPAGTLLPALRHAVQAAEPDVPSAGPSFFTQFQPLDAYYASMTRTRRFTSTLITAFAGVALLLSAVGLLAVLAFMVARRGREIGVRMALGATRGDAAWLVLRQSTLLVCLGVAAGFLASIPATRLLEASLFNVPRFDPTSYALSGAVFFGVAALVVLIPAWRAARVDPMTALRAE